MKRARQLELPLRTWGGARKGAGRKPKGAKAGVSHRARPKVTRHTPAHVTLRLVTGVPSLRRGALASVVKNALARSRVGANGRFRLAHYSVQSNHLHLIVEADSSAALAQGMKSLATRVARAVNRQRAVSGKVFADRYHARVIKTPSEARNALLYVLNNSRKHGSVPPTVAFDAHSSADVFNGWRGHKPTSPPTITVAARSWILTTGWRRHGLLDAFAVPVCTA